MVIQVTVQEFFAWLLATSGSQKFCEVLDELPVLRSKTGNSSRTSHHVSAPSALEPAMDCLPDIFRRQGDI